MELNKRISIIAAIISKNSGIGKTAIMKYIYLLQKVYKVPMGYDYSIYTYGPYSSAVMGDIDFANSMDIIDVARQVYENGLSGYCITPLEKADEMIAQQKGTVEEYMGAIQEMLSFFGDKSAKELELLTTIIYIYSNYKENQCDTRGVSENVHDIKPHFDIEVIESEYEKLNSLGILERAVVA